MNQEPLTPGWAPADPPAPGPQRVRVTGPRSGTGYSPARFSVSRELDEQSEVGELFIRSLIRSQLRLALVVAGGFGAVVLGVLLLVLLLPGNGVALWTVPLPWLLLGLGIYPVVLGCAGLYLRAAARNERRFRDLVSESEG
ncbi:hypothetical protein LVY72_00605 [Arthrobacter sp. I2-34]|uniref:Integral membrane protein n=1 Tax=Arthrobacter hankyongi TaxID=2904801 RepID=A0ABS9L1A6_9MICC|nr:hypothetical protein [Arthrobacter hankyongi]MCG2620410.1 hypothetical protein [Arthrobacter hankyongi]